MNKKFLLIILLIIFPIKVSALNISDLALKSNNIVLYNLDDNSILYERNKDEKVSIASMTKILTAMVVIENKKDLNEKIILKSADFKNVEKYNLATAGFKIGDNVTYEDLLYGLLFLSGGECAFALANNTIFNYDTFIINMNKLAKKIGLKNSSFTNPVGYDEDKHYSTVNDVYLLFKYAMENNTFKKIITKKSFTTSNNMFIKNNVLNKFLSISGKKYMIAGKTGTTKKAGYSLASVIKLKDINLMLVTTSTPLDYKAYYNFYDAYKIYEYFLNNYEYRNLTPQGKVLVTTKIKYTKDDKALITTNEKLKKYINKNTNNIKYKYISNNKLKFNSKKNKLVGKIKVYVDDKEVGVVNAILKNDLKFSLQKWIMANKLVFFFVIICIIFIVIFNLKILKKLIKRIKSF